jgi:hypothetical protein
MSKTAVHITKRSDIDQLIALTIQAGEGYRAPLMRAASAGHLSLIGAKDGSVIPAKYLQIARPLVALLADDHSAAVGPGGWKQAQELLRWANVAILHATGGQPEQYAMVAASALIMHRVLLIEMQERHHAAWRALAERQTPRLKLISIVPPPGDSHPRVTVPAGTVMQ